jgi:hypothetical protein
MRGIKSTPPPPPLNINSYEIIPEISDFLFILVDQVEDKNLAFLQGRLV